MDVAIRRRALITVALVIAAIAVFRLVANEEVSATFPDLEECRSAIAELAPEDGPYACE